MLQPVFEAGPRVGQNTVETRKRCLRRLHHLLNERQHCRNFVGAVKKYTRSADYSTTNFRNETCVSIDLRHGLTPMPLTPGALNSVLELQMAPDVLTPETCPYQIGPRS